MRGSAVLVTQVWQALKSSGLSSTSAALWVGACCVALAFAALAVLPETFGRDLDYEET